MSPITPLVVTRPTSRSVRVERQSTMVDTYQISVNGRLGPEMVHLLADLHPEIREHSTVLHTEDIGQASLHGTLARLRNLGLEIDSVRKIDADASGG